MPVNNATRPGGTPEIASGSERGFPIRVSASFGPIMAGLCFMLAAAALTHLLKRMQQLFVHGQNTRWALVRYYFALSLIIMEPLLFSAYVLFGPSEAPVMPIILAQYGFITASGLVLRSLVPPNSGTSNDWLAISVLLILFQGLTQADTWPFVKEGSFWYLYPVLWLPSPLIWGCTLAVSVAWYNAERQRQRQTPFEQRHWVVYYSCLVFLVGMDVLASYSEAWAYLVSAIISVMSKTGFVFFWLYQERRLAQQLELIASSFKTPAGASLKVRVLPLRLAVIGQFIHTGSQCWRLLVDFLEFYHGYLFTFGMYTSMKVFAVMGDLVTSLGVIWLLATHSTSKPSKTALTEPLLEDPAVSAEFAGRPPILFKTPKMVDLTPHDTAVQLSQRDPSRSESSSSGANATNAQYGQRSRNQRIESRSRPDREGSDATAQPSPAVSLLSSPEIARACRLGSSVASDSVDASNVQAERDGASSFALSRSQALSNVSTQASWHLRHERMESNSRP
eukprot:gb/GEZN01004665.1/.p1 GENE.gb/GEZN01004665.1/~~gb/GEZN01004665.1/.p1  ORF type:complete len:550 (-),score=46.99 gb/GEZN01004665.1/:277-1797(-)